jgi:hypothetical protein
MKMNRENVKLCARLMSIRAIVAVADALVVVLMRRPFPWTVIIRAFTPEFIAVFVILPMNKGQTQREPSV